jgi:hypothetical protein
MPAGAVLHELVAVRDLDAVRPDALPEVVAAIAADPALRPALVGPARIVAGGAAFDVPPYTAWWLREELADGVAPPALAGPDAEPGLADLLPPAPGWVRELDPAAQQALGVVAATTDLDATAVPALLDALANEEVPVAPGLLVRLLARLAELGARGLEVERPARVRGIVPAGAGFVTRVVDADRAVVVDAPMYRQRPDLGAQLPAGGERATALADLLDLPLAAEVAAGGIGDEGGEGGTAQPTPAAVRALVPDAPPTWCEHDELLVDGVEVDWWVTGAGAGLVVHAATTDGLARALAWAGGRWELRTQVAEVLVDPGAVGDVLIDGAFL